MRTNFYITVCTPTFNSSHLIHRVFNSLKRQEYKNFEWIIIDDGSTDETNSIVERYKLEAEGAFPIIYYYQKNQHKKVALYNGIQIAKGQLFVTCDADDEMMPYTLRYFCLYWSDIYNSKEYVCVNMRCVDQNGNIVGKLFPSFFVDSNYLDMEYKLKLNTDFIECWRTDFLKEHFINLSRIKGFVPEAYWMRKYAALGYKTRYFNTVGRIYYRDVETSIKNSFYDNIKKNLAGLLLNLSDELDNYLLKYIMFSPLSFIRSAISYNAFRMFDKKNKEIALKNIFPKVISILCYPLGIYRYKKLIRRMKEY